MDAASVGNWHNYYGISVFQIPREEGNATLRASSFDSRIF